MKTKNIVYLGRQYESPKHGVCLAYNLHVHNHQLIVTMKNSDGKSINFSMNNFQKEFINRIDREIWTEN
jgi:hypothetical protein